LASIQRLAGLGLPSSREALREVISRGTENESKWALLALLRTGDGSAVSLAVPLLLNLRYDEPGPYVQPEAGMALAIKNLRDPTAVPELIEILDGAPDELVRDCASQALMETRDPRALDTLADHLSDPSQYVRYNSLVGMGYITHAPPCMVTDPKEAETAEPVCKSWWKSSQ
jgi:HEAT repeat protein